MTLRQDAIALWLLAAARLRLAVSLARGLQHHLQSSVSRSLATSLQHCLHSLCARQAAQTAASVTGSRSHKHEDAAKAQQARGEHKVHGRRLTLMQGWATTSRNGEVEEVVVQQVQAHLQLLDGCQLRGRASEGQLAPWLLRLLLWHLCPAALVR